MAEKTQDGRTVFEPSDMIIIGEKIKQFGGLLVDIVDDDRYPEKVRYVMVAKDGKEYEVCGNAALSKRIRRHMVGCILLIKYLGMKRGSQNVYKDMEVTGWTRDETPENMKKAFPRWYDFEEGKKPDGPAAPPPTSEPDFGL